MWPQIIVSKENCLNSTVYMVFLPKSPHQAAMRYKYIPFFPKMFAAHFWFSTTLGVWSQIEKMNPQTNFHKKNCLNPIVYMNTATKFSLRSWKVLHLVSYFFRRLLNSTYQPQMWPQMSSFKEKCLNSTVYVNCHKIQPSKLWGFTASILYLSKTLAPYLSTTNVAPNEFLQRKMSEFHGVRELSKFSLRSCEVLQLVSHFFKDYTTLQMWPQMSSFEEKCLNSIVNMNCHKIHSSKLWGFTVCILFLLKITLHYKCGLSNVFLKKNVWNQHCRWGLAQICPVKF